ncbi:E3 ubiquitin-protein ligase synoviolin [Striga asiatica]|uniref:E3 ubiquitin-protein ligase synoviolin n=1 Tax=Striga asiatica TaxID=4170 RepID=A0A5A7QXG3_STRAF|nr:E3 ubiquitin-protein ligase synoviolin [Striga asiatica]
MSQPNPPNTSNSQAEDSNQIIPAREESSHFPSQTEETPSPTQPQPNLNPTPNSIMMIENASYSSQGHMDIEHNNLQITETYPDSLIVAKAKGKSWKRSTSKDGRLMRQEDRNAMILR